MATRLTHGDEVEVQGYHPRVDGQRGVVDGREGRYVRVSLPNLPGVRLDGTWIFKPEELRRVR